MRADREWATYAGAQVRLVLAAAATSDPPLLGAVSRALTGTPRVSEESIAGIPATLCRPAGGHGPWTTIVVVPGVTRRGRGHPAFRAIGRCLAAAGFLVATIEPEGLSVGELRQETIADARDALEAVASLPECDGEHVAVAGVSGGAILALLLAAEPGLADRISVVAALAPCCDIEQAIRMVTTETYAEGTHLHAFAPGSFFRLAIARSVVASLPDGEDREALRAELLALDDHDPVPFAPLRRRASGLDGPARRVVELLANEDPRRFDELYGALPEAQREKVSSLSAIRVASRIEARVELVVGRNDKYVPLADASAFVDACPTARLTVLDSLAHAVPQFGVRELRDLARLDAAVVRVLAAAGGCR